MRRKLIIFFAILAICALFTPIVSAHSPVFPGNNTSLDSAYVVNDPTKSWALYTTLQPGQVQYYRFDVTQGESIYVQLYKNTEASNLGFLPSFVLMGPGLTSNGTVPANVAVPPGASNIVMQGQQPDEATYEGFGPGSFYDLGSVEVRAPATGTYYVAVYDAANGGAYGLAIGERETYTPRCDRPSRCSVRLRASSSSGRGPTPSYRCSLPSRVRPLNQKRSSRSYSCSCPSS